jgi:ribonucleoside-diphosphate reductase alpha chain
MEQPLIPFGCCNLSAINIHKFVVDGAMDWSGLYDTSRQVIKLMDNAIEVMDYPDERFKDTSSKYRQVGIGPMGLSDAMFELGIKYDSLKGKEFAGRVMKTITSGALEGSTELAREKGTFYDYDSFKENMESVANALCDSDERLMQLIRDYGLRHSAVSTAAPTGTTSISCDTSYGIEPCFGLVFQKNLIDGSKMMFVNSIFQRRFENEEWYTDDLIDKIFHNGGSLKGIRGIPKEVREVFVTAHDIKPKDRIDVQAAMQQYCSSAISSTVNLPEETTKDEISELYLYAYEKGLKGITTYRDGCKQNQPVSFKPVKDGVESFVRPTRLTAEVFRIETGNGTLYVTVSSSAGKPVELFMSIGKSGQILNTLSEALGRVISIALQGGVSVDNIVKTLIGINSDKPIWHRLDEADSKPVQILSIPDGLAQLLNRYYANGKFNGVKVDTERCPNCGNPMLMIEGCMACTCGYSRCG